MRNLLLLAVILLCLGCENDEDSRPWMDAAPGTMKITLDGTTMISSPKSPAHANIPTNYGFGDIHGVFEINADEFVHVAILVQDIRSGVFSIDGNSDRQSSKVYVEYYPNDNLGFYGSYNSTKAVAGEVKLTRLDRENKLISGTFEVEVARPSEPKIVTITKGSFNQLPIDQ